MIFTIYTVNPGVTWNPGVNETIVEVTERNGKIVVVTMKKAA